LPASEITTELLIEQTQLAIARMLLSVGDNPTAPQAVEALARSLQILTTLKTESGKVFT
jgi:hypothetical protein